MGNKKTEVLGDTVSCTGKVQGIQRDPPGNYPHFQGQSEVQPNKASREGEVRNLQKE